MGALYERGYVKRVLVVAPTTVVPVWPKEMETMADFPFTAAVMLGTKAKRLKALREMLRQGADALRMVCINYQEIFREGIYDALEAYDADMMILDEGHYIKTHTSRTAKAAYELGSRARFRLLLTGTPVTNRATDLFGQFRFVDSRVFGKNFYQFRNRYCIMGGFQNKVVVGEKNQDEMIRKLHSVSLRVTKADALDLPEETSLNRYIDLEPEQFRLYEELRKAGLAELAGGEVSAPLIITKMLRLQQVCGGWLQPDGEDKPVPVGKAKINALREILEDVVVDGEQKLVIFARFLPEVTDICGLLAEMRINYGVIYGAIPQEERGWIVERFQTEPKVRVFVAQIQTAGLGITLHAASTAVFYSADFSYANYAQACARIHRIGQKYPCTYINLIARGTIDEKIQQALGRKADLSAGICDNWREYFMEG